MDPLPGMSTGWTATNPLTGERVPVWLAPYVLGDVGTGAVMGVPGHDGRDARFAAAFALPKRNVLDGEGETATVCNSGAPWDGLAVPNARVAITQHLQRIDRGRSATTV